MLHLLRRHPIAVTAFFRHSLVLTYALPPEILAPLLPEGLVLETFRGYAFLAIAMVQTEDLRPSALPASLGRDFFLSGYRIFTRLAGGAQSKRGLKILRSDANRKWMVRAGNLLTHYNYRLCRAELEECEGRIHWTVATQEQEADLEVVADVVGAPAALPEGSPFATVEEARRFAGPLPYTFELKRKRARSSACWPSGSSGIRGRLRSRCARARFLSTNRFAARGRFWPMRFMCATCPTAGNAGGA